MAKRLFGSEDAKNILARLKYIDGKLFDVKYGERVTPEAGAAYLALCASLKMTADRAFRSTERYGEDRARDMLSKGFERGIADLEDKLGIKVEGRVT